MFISSIYVFDHTLYFIHSFYTLLSSFKKQRLDGWQTTLRALLHSLFKTHFLFAFPNICLLENLIEQLAFLKANFFRSPKEIRLKKKTRKLRLKTQIYRALTVYPGFDCCREETEERIWNLISFETSSSRRTYFEFD